MEKLPKNRLIEDKKFYDRVFGQILDELENLSRTFDKEMAEMGYGRIWAERINKIKNGEKLASHESEIRKIVFEAAQNLGLSNTEREYLMNSIFNLPKKRQTDDD